MLLSSTPPTFFTFSNKCHLSHLSASSRYVICGKRNTLGLFQRHQQSMTLPSLPRSFRLEASLQCDSMDSLPPSPAIHGVSDTIVGVLGGGQLGRMLCQAASQMAVKVITLDPLENCPASSLSYEHYVGRFDDGVAVSDFAKRCEVLTIEIEHVDAITLENLEKQGVDCQPKPSTIRIIQDKYIQKVHFSQHGIPHPDFVKIDSLESAEKAANLFGFPLMLKSRRQAYDGRGNAVAHQLEELSSAVSTLGGYERGLYAERWTSFIKELSVIVARGRDGSVLSYPVVETIHKDSICHIVEAPADVSEKIKKLSVDIALRAVSSLEGAGVFAVELFLTENGQVLLNEVAPRPHNSGHHTIESCYTSQYEQHLRAVIGLKLGDTTMKTPNAIMYNLLGEAEGEKGFYLAHQLIKRALNIPGASIHWYDKPDMRKLRKMGHITVVGPSRNNVRKSLDLILNRESTKCSTSDTQVAIVMDSDSELTTMKGAAEILAKLHVPFELTTISAHQTPKKMYSFALSAKERGIQVIITSAGGAAHLPGMVASLIPLPVIGVPIRTSSLVGVDSLLSIMQMPKGIPVATVAIENAANAALLSVRMLATRDDQLWERLNKYHEDLGDTVLENVEKFKGEDTKVSIIMGSDSDLPTMKDAAEILNTFHVPFEITIVSAHRTPERMYSFALSAKKRGIQVIIAGAGGAAHLPGMVASLTSLPVIGVPIKTSTFNGVDSLLSIVQMSKDIPVATVAVGNAANAALLAVRILANGDDKLWERLIEYHEKLRDTVLEKAGKLEEGWEKYLNH